jgi:formylglycine-generating enzyme required for sulfatase activity
MASPNLQRAEPQPSLGHPLALGTGPGWADGWGEDRQFGPFVILELPRPGGGAPVRQRWRWVPPGSFIMGSPPDEPGRDDDEGPAHWVTLTRGYWIADTPCTQAFWEAVMGGNPSRFLDPLRPVEQVSWDEVQVFLERLNSRVPGLQAALPTEAQWEYACRAGSQTALYPANGSSGKIVILDDRNAPALDPIAWYGGNSGVDFELDNGLDSARWPQKQYPHRRAGTRRVAEKLPNAWGLYDMLGNVWEWCADGKRKYASQAMVDALGPLEGVGSRCVRGGSWNNGARHVRCAFRYGLPPGYRREYLGFRLVRVQDRS